MNFSLKSCIVILKTTRLSSKFLSYNSVESLTALGYKSLMFGWLKAKSETTSPARAPENTRIYAIGDVHGRLDCLLDLLGQIERDAATYSGQKILIGLGDYIDRGPDSKGVIERLMQPLEDFECHFLKGNHEQSLLSLFERTDYGKGWLTYGGLETLVSYRIPYQLGAPTPERLEGLRQTLLELFPASHRSWLAQLQLHLTFGDYHFVHAGVKPGIPLAEQSDDSRLWIRDEFLHYKGRLEKVIVHGHTISEEVETRPHRIGIDTGAYASGCLTALVLESEQRRLLQTKLP
jgi:serine/threonine protein phosphatase 1